MAFLSGQVLLLDCQILWSSIIQSSLLFHFSVFVLNFYFGPVDSPQRFGLNVWHLGVTQLTWLIRHNMTEPHVTHCPTRMLLYTDLPASLETALWRLLGARIWGELSNLLHLLSATPHNITCSECGVDLNPLFSRLD